MPRNKSVKKRWSIRLDTKKYVGSEFSRGLLPLDNIIKATKAAVARMPKRPNPITPYIKRQKKMEPSQQRANFLREFDGSLGTNDFMGAVVPQRKLLGKKRIKVKRMLKLDSLEKRSLSHLKCIAPQAEVAAVPNHSDSGNLIPAETKVNQPDVVWVLFKPAVVQILPKESNTTTAQEKSYLYAPANETTEDVGNQVYIIDSKTLNRLELLSKQMDEILRMTKTEDTERTTDSNA